MIDFHPFCVGPAQKINLPLACMQKISFFKAVFQNKMSGLGLFCDLEEHFSQRYFQKIPETVRSHGVPPSSTMSFIQGLQVTPQ